MGEGGKVAQFEVVVAGDAVVLADGGEDFGLFDGVDAEVGLQVEVDVEQVGGVSGELGDDADHGVGDLVSSGGLRVGGGFRCRPNGNRCSRCGGGGHRRGLGLRQHCLGGY